MKVLGILLVVLGVLAILYGGFSYVRSNRVIDAGPLQVTSRQRETVPIPPLVGIGAVIAGALLLASSGRRRMA